MFFNNYGTFILVKNEQTNEDSILGALLDYEIIDIIEHEDNFEVYVNPNHFYEAKKSLQLAHFNIHDAEIKLVAQNKKDITDEQLLTKIEKFIESCENDDDIQSIVTNLL